jgi:putative phosphoribosyl transferase
LFLDNKTVVLVDDGAATGATMITSGRWLRTKGVRNLIITIPVAPKDTVNLLKNEHIDHIEVITSPTNSAFRSIEQYYQSF